MVLGIIRRNMLSWYKILKTAWLLSLFEQEVGDQFDTEQQAQPSLLRTRLVFRSHPSIFS